MKIKLDLIGAGGNGSWLIPMLARLAEEIPIDITIWDFDKIERKNIKNQNLPFIKLDQPKAKVLAELYNRVCKPIIPISYRVEKYEKPETTDIIITAVDNNESRLLVGDSNTWEYWLDCGVEKNRSYAAVNTRKYSPSKEIFLQAQPDSLLGCTYFSTPSQNIIAAASTFLLLYNVVKEIPLTKRFIVYNKENGISNVGSNIDFESLLGYVISDPSNSIQTIVMVDKFFYYSWLLKWLAHEFHNRMLSVCIKKDQKAYRYSNKFAYPNINQVIAPLLHEKDGSFHLAFWHGNAYENLNNTYDLYVCSSKNGAYMTCNVQGCMYSKIDETIVKDHHLTINKFYYHNTMIDTSDVENLSDIIRACLSSFVLALQVTQRLITKIEVGWDDTLKCTTKRLTTENY